MINRPRATTRGMNRLCDLVPALGGQWFGGCGCDRWFRIWFHGRGLICLWSYVLRQFFQCGERELRDVRGQGIDILRSEPHGGIQP